MALTPNTPASPRQSGVTSSPAAAGASATTPMSTPSGTTTPDPLRTEAMCALLAQNWWAVALRGVFAILFGVIALLVPGATILSLVLLFSGYMLVDGIFGIVAALRAARKGERWGLLVVEGVLNIAVGVVAFLWPGLTAITFVVLLAAWSLVSGGLMLGAAFRLTREHGRWWLVFGGLVSIVFGVLLAIAPVIGAVVLTWWLGAYALAFGVALLVLAFRLRARKDDRRAAGLSPTPQAAGGVSR
jgi:uncharacterized membrane protein HdeD (DUF308 family)